MAGAELSRGGFCACTPHIRLQHSFLPHPWIWKHSGFQCLLVPCVLEQAYDRIVDVHRRPLYSSLYKQRGSKFLHCSYKSIRTALLGQVKGLSCPASSLKTTAVTWCVGKSKNKERKQSRAFLLTHSSYFQPEDLWWYRVLHLGFLLCGLKSALETVGFSIRDLLTKLVLFCFLFRSQYFPAFNYSCDQHWALNCLPHRSNSLVETCFILLSWFPKRQQVKEQLFTWKELVHSTVQIQRCPLSLSEFLS